MTITGIVFLLLIGMILVLAEILVVPGVGVVGIIGGLLMLLGIYFSYQIDTLSGHICLGSSAAFSLVSAYLALRTDTWDRFSLKDEVKGKVNNVDLARIVVGALGKTVSKLSPAGQALINDQLVEVHSKQGVIENNCNIEVVKVQQNKIIVIKSE